jgi:glycosyltransferase involved in cell wall biosynthesis
VAGLGVEDPLASGEAPQQRAERFLARHPRLRGKRILLFLGRLHKKKGVDLLVEACLRLFPSHPELHLVVAGTEDSSVNRQHLEARIAAAALQEQVTWTGPVYGAEKWETYCAASLFVLPSHSENFGLTIAEALACSVPILTTFRVNIWRELKEQGVGIIVDDTAQGTAEGIREFLASYPQPSPQLAVRARQTFQAAYDAGAAGRRLLAFLREDLANAGEARETAYA